MLKTLGLAHLAMVAFLIWSPSFVHAAEVGRPLDVVPFGQVNHWEADQKDYGVMWEDSRDIFQVVVEFSESAALPSAEQIKLQYWRSSWPKHRIPRNEPSGAGSSGWLDIGDWHQGKWMTADVKLDIQGPRYTFTFNPINAQEFKDLADFNADYRTTMKLRVLGEAALPDIKTFQAYSDSVYQPFEFEIVWGGTADKEQNWDGQLEVFNGILEKIEPQTGSQVRVKSEHWHSKVKGKTDGIRARILYAEKKVLNSFDETVVTVRAAHETFSFSISDLIKSGSIFIPDFGVLVRKSGETVTYAAAEQNWRTTKTPDFYTRVKDMPEQTFTQAWNDTPLKSPHYIPLSFEGGRQHFGVSQNGSAYCIKNWIRAIPGKDTDLCNWQGNEIRYHFGLPESLPTERGLVDGFLPMIATAWEKDGVRYRQTAFVTPLMGVPNAGGRIWADDTLVLMMRLEIEPISSPMAAELKLSVTQGDKQEPITLEDGRYAVVAADPKIKRYLITCDPRFAAELTSTNESITYETKFDNSRTRVIDIAIPYITLSDPKEWAQLKSLSFDSAFQDVRSYWHERVAVSAEIETPEPMINDFYKAHVSHLLINTEREVGISDRYMAKVGTFHYGVFTNESCMMISDLDRRGYHERAEQALETWLHYQGTLSLPGDFSTGEGQFYGARGYEAGGYNQHHGWVLWCLGEHYLYTRDARWLAHAAPHIIKACDWIINERRRTIVEAERTPIRAIERGLLPQGRLEDIGDWRSWQSTNVYTWWGMQTAASALVAAGHSEGTRLLEEAESYRQDILASYSEAMRRSPVVRLRDGSWIPHIPSDVHRRGRSFGWITETLEGAIHMVRCGMLEPWERVSTWIIKDFEDNLYLSEEFGYNITGAELDRYWFSRGGISMQANLLCNPIPYLLRDEPKHFLRSYFNGFAVSYFPDTRMMTEHALPNIGDWRGDHYKSSDEANSTYWLRMMFVQERGQELWLGAAVPRYWLTQGQEIGIQRAATHFGPMSMSMISEVDQGRITMSIDPPLRNPPKRIRARFRHPEGLLMTACEINSSPHDKFSAEEEWVEIPRAEQSLNVTVYYGRQPTRKSNSK